MSHYILKETLTGFSIDAFTYQLFCLRQNSLLLMVVYKQRPLASSLLSRKPCNIASVAIFFICMDPIIILFFVLMLQKHFVDNCFFIVPGKKTCAGLNCILRYTVLYSKILVLNKEEVTMFWFVLFSHIASSSGIFSYLFREWFGDCEKV